MHKTIHHTTCKNTEFANTTWVAKNISKMANKGSSRKVQVAKVIEDSTELQYIAMRWR